MARRKVPKSIAGVKIPKSFRKRGVISAVLAHPVGRTVVAEALVAAAGAAAIALSREARGGGDDGRRAERDEDRDDGRRRPASSGLGGVVGDIVRTIVADRASRIVRDGDAGRGKKKKKKKRDKHLREPERPAAARADRPRDREETRWTPPADPNRPH